MPIKKRLILQKQVSGFVGPGNIEPAKKNKNLQRVLHTNIVMSLKLSSRVIRGYYADKMEATEIQREVIRGVAKAFNQIVEGFSHVGLSMGPFIGWLPDTYSVEKNRLAESFIEGCSWSEDLAGDRQKETYKNYAVNVVTVCNIIANLDIIETKDVPTLVQAHKVLEMLAEYYVGQDKTDQSFIDFIEALNS